MLSSQPKALPFLFAERGQGKRGLLVAGFSDGAPCREREREGESCNFSLPSSLSSPFSFSILPTSGTVGRKGKREVTKEREREREREGEMAYHAILPLGDGGGDGGKGGERLLLPSPPPTHSPFPLSLSDESVSTTFSSMVCLNGWGGWNFSE